MLIEVVVFLAGKRCKQRTACMYAAFCCESRILLQEIVVRPGERVCNRTYHSNLGRRSLHSFVGECTGPEGASLVDAVLLNAAHKRRRKENIGNMVGSVGSDGFG